MPISFMMTSLLAVSLFTNLTVEGIKKLLNGTTAKYSSNILAAVVSALIAIAVSVVYMIMGDISFTVKTGVDIAVLVYLSFLTSTVGYDKIVQAIKQIQSNKQDN